MQYIGMTANAFERGRKPATGHSHAKVEELYVFLTGRGQMALDDDIVDVGPGSAVRVGQGVWRIWRALPDSPEPMRWVCMRAGGEQLPRLPDDGTRAPDRPSPW